MHEIAQWTKCGLVAGAILISPAALIYVVPFAAGIAGDVVHATGGVPLALMLGLTIALVSLRKMRLRSTPRIDSAG